MGHGEAQEKAKAEIEAHTKEATVAEREEKESQNLVKLWTRKKVTFRESSANATEQLVKPGND